MNHPLLGEIVSVRSPRARRISISVRASGEVRLVRPWCVSEERAAAFLNEKVAWVVRTRERLASRCAGPSVRLSPEERKARVEVLRRAAKEELPSRIAALSRATGLKYGRLSIRASRSKWGSCSGRNDISLSLFLMNLPAHLRDYVIVHELCHTVHHNHSAAFHALVDRLLGGREKELARELKRYAAEP